MVTKKESPYTSSLINHFHLNENESETAKRQMCCTRRLKKILHRHAQVMSNELRRNKLNNQIFSILKKEILKIQEGELLVDDVIFLNKTRIFMIINSYNVYKYSTTSL